MLGDSDGMIIFLCRNFLIIPEQSGIVIHSLSNEGLCRSSGYRGIYCGRKIEMSIGCYCCMDNKSTAQYQLYNIIMAFYFGIIGHGTM